MLLTKALIVRKFHFRTHYRLSKPSLLYTLAFSLALSRHHCILTPWDPHSQWSYRLYLSTSHEVTLHTLSSLTQCSQPPPCRSLIPCSSILIGDVLDEWAEDGHLLGEAGLGALLLLGAQGFAAEVSHAVLKTLLSCVEEILCRCLEVQEVTCVCLLLLLLVHYFIIY